MFVKMKKFIHLLVIFFFPIFFSQNNFNDLKYLKGTWEGSVDGHKVTVNIFNEEPIRCNIPLITFTNFQNQKFIIFDALVSKNIVREIMLEVQKATLSSCEKCDFVYGKIKIICKDENNILMNVNGVGPHIWTSYDVKEGMSDINNLELTKIKN